MKLVIALCLVACTPSSSAPGWVATWATSPQPADPDEPIVIGGRTLRQVVRVSAGGARVRLRLSNAYGTAPLALRSVHVALHATGAAIRPDTDRVVHFAREPTVVIPPSGVAISDPVALSVPALGELAITLSASGAALATAEHAFAGATAFLAEGDTSQATDLVSPRTLTSWHVVVGVDVEAAPAPRAIVAFGDSVTDGMGSTRDANRRWPDRLAERAGRAVVSAGIAGNQLLDELVGDPGLARFDRDVLAQPGVGFVIVSIGVNDLGAFDGPGATADQLIAGYRAVIAKAHAHGIRAIGATLLPYAGTKMYTEAGDRERASVNAWIRTSGAFDGVIDFDAVMRDPAQPSHLLPAFDSGDHVHPDDAGYRAMADAIDLSLFAP